MGGGGRAGEGRVVTELQIKQWTKGTSRASAFLPCPVEMPQDLSVCRTGDLLLGHCLPTDPRAYPVDECDNLGDDKRQIPVLTSENKIPRQV